MKFLSLFLMLFSLNAIATTWGQKEIIDPLDEGATCSVQVLGSTGSYVFHYPSKYDQVFSPFTTLNGIWYCKISGFISLMGDFEEVTDSEKKEIKEYLKKNKPNLIDIASQLKHLEAIYSLRTKSVEFENRLKRIIAYMYEQSGDIETANNYRKKVLIDIKKALTGKLEENKKLEYLYLAANYERQFGNQEQSNKYISKLKNNISHLKDNKLKGYSEYLSKLLDDTVLIKKGGVLKPLLLKEAN